MIHVDWFANEKYFNLRILFITVKKFKSEDVIFNDNES